MQAVLRAARKEDGMIIKNAEFLTSVADPGKLPDLGVPEIAFAGKSNVGKSSFINFLTGNGKLARTSGDPGRTRLVNYFGVNGKSLVFVDLPGYGFAKVAKSEKAKWGSMIEGYLTGSKNLVNVFVLLDVRHEPTPDDKMLLNFLYHYNIRYGRWYLKSVFVLYKHDVFTLESGNLATPSFAQKAYFISYFHNALFIHTI